MGMSTSVYGIVPADEKFNQMKKIWEMCEQANVAIPEDVVDFFDGERPDGTGVVIYLNEDTVDAVTEWGADMQSGYEVDISKLDPKIKIIRFANSW